MSDPAPKGLAAEARASLLKLTPRNWINVGVVVLVLLSVVAQRYGFEPLADYGLDASHAKTAAIAFAVGAFFPGSPIGRLLDYAASFIGGPPAAPPSAADLQAIEGTVFQRPTRLAPGSSGAPASPGPYSDKSPARPVQVPPTLHRTRFPEALALVVLSVVLTVGGSATLMHGCGASPLRTQAIAADIAGTTVDSACQEMGSRRTDELASAIEHPELGDATVATIRARYAPAAAACNLMADAHDAWTDELQNALAAKEAGQPYELDVSLAARVVATWPDVQAALESVGVHVPDPAKDLLAIVAAYAASTLDGGTDGGLDAGSDAGVDGGAL